MNVTVFTSCQPRHLALIERLAGVAETVYACIEVTTLFPGRVEDFYKRSEVMQGYFGHVIDAERAEFGEPRFLPHNVRALPMKMGDLSILDPESIRSALDSDLIVVFGASFIRRPLVDSLVERRALNLHMGTSPYYRGTACNFWSIYDGKPDYVGATIHLLTRGLDSGPMLCHALPSSADAKGLDGFALGMRAVRVGFDTLVSIIGDGRWRDLEPVPQDRSLEIRYSRSRDFTDEIASAYLARVLTSQEIERAVSRRDVSRFILLDGAGQSPRTDGA